MGLFSKTKETGSSESNGSKLDEKNEIPNTREVFINEPVPPVKRRTVDKTPGEIDTRGRRSSDRTRPIINKIVSGESMGQILFSLTEELKGLFDCQAVTVFAVDREKRQIFSRNFQSDKVEEIRLDISSKSLAGFVAATGKTLNIQRRIEKNSL